MTLIHSERDPVGGAARFVSVIKEYRDKRYAEQPDLLILFSGDVFNPSIESTVTKVNAVIQGFFVTTGSTHGPDFARRDPSRRRLLRKPWYGNSLLGHFDH
jgi:hypothetical protein